MGTDLRTLAIVSSLPKCDFCAEEGIDRPARFDYKTRYGPWANGCQEHFEQHRMRERLGLGFGQMLVTPAEMDPQ